MLSITSKEGIQINVTLTGEAESLLGKERFEKEVPNKVLEVVEGINLQHSLGLEFLIALPEVLLVFQIVTVTESNVTVELVHTIDEGHVADVEKT